MAERDRRGPVLTVRLRPAEVAALQDALDVALAFRVAGQDVPVLEDLYALFASWQADGA